VASKTASTSSSTKGFLVETEDHSPVAYPVPSMSAIEQLLGAEGTIINKYFDAKVVIDTGAFFIILLKIKASTAHSFPLGLLDNGEDHFVLVHCNGYVIRIEYNELASDNPRSASVSLAWLPTTLS